MTTEVQPASTADSHPSAAVPERLFDDETAEQRWRERFSAIRIALPEPARDAPQRTSYVTNATGTYELMCWDSTTGTHTQATDRPDGTVHGGLSADGNALWWFDDDAGDEFGSWKVQNFGSGPGNAREALPGVPPGYPAGLEIGRTVRLAAFSDDDGSRVHLSVGDGEAAVVYRHTEDAGVGALSYDESIWVLSHSEHGDSRYSALRALSVEATVGSAEASLPGGAAVIGELSDIPGKGLHALTFSPVAGDQRLLVGHERHGRDELLIWDVATGGVTELTIDLPGDLEADFYPDGTALLVVHTHAGRAELFRYTLADGTLTPVPAAPGVISGAVARPDGDLWYRHSSASSPGSVRVLGADGQDRLLLEPPGGLAPGSEPLQDVWVDGRGGRIHALIARPVGAPPLALDGGSNLPLPTVFVLHGGPAAQDDDSFDASRAAWLDAGFCVVAVNYRGSTGYGSAWRDALSERVGHTELADVAAVHDHLVRIGVVDVRASVVTGYSWGGYLSLLAAGTQNSRWAAVIAGVPVADYLAAYEDEMEPLRAYDRALFGGSPDEVRHKYLDASPITFVDLVRAPVLVVAGANDPRCPIRQIDNYLDELHRRDKSYQLYRYDAGHGSMVVAERLRQVAVEIGFVRTVLGDRAPR
ncbi:S9 family peptidase [Nakamurella silvestris]|nr:S9 family peptidase [Nakamurella silvestris]